MTTMQHARNVNGDDIFFVPIDDIETMLTPHKTSMINILKYELKKCEECRDSLNDKIDNEQTILNIVKIFQQI